MNENELKELWKSEEANNLPNINFGHVQKSIEVWQNKLRGKIKFEFIVNALMLISLIPLSFIVPKFVYFVPIILLMTFWSYLKLWEIYKQETKPGDLINTKEFLEQKTKLLTNYMHKLRLIGYLVNVPIIVATMSVQATLQELYEHRVQMISIIVFLEIFVIIICEIYFRIMYIPVIKKSQELLEQLESED